MPPRYSELRREFLQQQHAVSDTFDVEIVAGRSPVIEQQHGAIAAGEELLELKNLPPIPQCGIREHAELGERVEDEALRLQSLDFGKQCLRGAIQLYLRRMEERAFGAAPQLRLDGGKLEEVDLAQIPAVR